MKKTTLSYLAFVLMLGGGIGRSDDGAKAQEPAIQPAEVKLARDVSHVLFTAQAGERAAVAALELPKLEGELKRLQRALERLGAHRPNLDLADPPAGRAQRQQRRKQRVEDAVSALTAHRKRFEERVANVQSKRQRRIVRRAILEIERIERSCKEVLAADPAERRQRSRALAQRLKPARYGLHDHQTVDDSSRPTFRLAPERPALRIAGPKGQNRPARPAASQ